MVRGHSRGYRFVVLRVGNLIFLSANLEHRLEFFPALRANIPIVPWKKKNDIFQTIVFNVKSMILDGEINRWILKIIGIRIWYFYPFCVDTRN